MLKIYNTLTKKLESFKPIEDKKVRFYHCGPTVYWTQHIGNLRGMMMADLIRRSLEYLGYDVNFVRNYTDVGHLTGDNLGDADTGEDKMEKGALREGLTPDEIADKYIRIFENDTKALNIEEPNKKPRATQYVKQMQKMITTLIEKSYAYVTPKAVYFDVSKFSNYNELNHQNLELNLSGAGTGDVSDANKKHSVDFALWFFKTGAHQNALQTWEFLGVTSEEVENGRGFPGWHIECSAMSKALLGDTIDIHMGGIEHIPVHHTNEIAQSEASNGVKFVNYWLHNEHLNVNGKKMSKSEGTGYSLQEVVSKKVEIKNRMFVNFEPFDLRYFFLNSHYRSKQNFTWDALKDAKIARENFDERVWSLPERKGNIVKSYKEKFIKAIENDFNIPQGLAIAWELLKSKEKEEDKRETILDFDKVLGLGLKGSQNIGRKILEPKHLKNIKIRNLIKERDEARLNKDFRKSDELRKLIEAEGYIVEDTKEGTKVYKKE
ncbi:cysteine--tRNA ligase [candidate division CPR3 bacterium GWF2_35_18]|uniref:Cysteine--tRNA ligase n=1 Tax=candidate division CPR3 bacterium GW2011_GWF2_35_18 TaxID=1618350 RepID=A0A0G0BK09_UNCC3|nr:MAG: Cysteine-tRNA ligase [candidate division CPR3 bacterium GW2011_GWF2_35_18]KKP85992.1 MAG: Cysteine-tRNA ligase [candidate division CPR3 bacterium GW2011_GWE2_35_7]OGB63722.1 MAG: cysteine--tRNA ligase [candidate division CPR3 bacterium GWF2_35_18]OGB64958.1 MAG: cysteine--tRNA ligase [candidate division CPR3 bacterium RIFOXYA2_FULL_35_13]OGB76564.1 MAG: cysteine--tRNA ligase [candidate division CPR3 bacterium RIFOXYC2_FULL_35_7]OGB78633.1 MAG: cysteine--tRNA ligase [candidate division 